MKIGFCVESLQLKLTFVYFKLQQHILMKKNYVYYLVTTLTLHSPSPNYNSNCNLDKIRCHSIGKIKG